MENLVEAVEQCEKEIDRLRYRGYYLILKSCEEGQEVPLDLVRETIDFSLNEERYREIPALLNYLNTKAYDPKLTRRVAKAIYRDYKTAPPYAQNGGRILKKIGQTRLARKLFRKSINHYAHFDWDGSLPNGMLARMLCEESGIKYPRKSLWDSICQNWFFTA